MSEARVKVNLQSGEIEFEGSEAFVENQLENLDALLELIAEATVGDSTGDLDNPPDESSFETEDNNSDGNPANSLDIPSSFGEWIHKFKDNISGTDKALLTAYYVQKESPDNDFKTRVVNRSLIEHGVKLANPSANLNRLVTKKTLISNKTKRLS